LEDSAFWNPLI